MIKTQVNLSTDQIKKIKKAHKDGVSVRIFLKFSKQPGEHTLLLTESQRNKIDENRKLGKGAVLDLNRDQLNTNHSGGFLPLLFAGLAALGALAGGGAAIANAVKTSQHQNAEEAEEKRHNLVMEKAAKGSGINEKQKLIKTLLNLSADQIRKIKKAYKSGVYVKIFLSKAKLLKQPGKHALLLTESQRDKIDKNVKLGKGIALRLSHNQLKTNHSGGFLPLLFAGLAALGALAGGSAAIANAVKTSQHQNVEEKETKRHNLEMEKAAKKGSGIKKTTKLCL